MNIKKTSDFFLLGSEGQLEACWHSVEQKISSKKIPANSAALVCHPHPLYGGTMKNKVVSTLVRAYRELGIPSLIFNYRGVGKSFGFYGEGIGESVDADTAWRWLRESQNVEHLYLAGFSFGAYVAAYLANHVETNLVSQIESLLLVAPPVEQFDFTGLLSGQYSTAVVVSDADEIVSSDEVLRWLNGLKRPVKLLTVKGASHFFHGRLNELKDYLVESYLN